MQQPNRMKEESRKRQLRLGIILLCALSFLLLACRLEASLGDPTTEPADSARVARRPTFTPRPVETDTPEVTATPQPSATPEPTDVPPTPVPTRRPAPRVVPTNPPPPPPPTATPVPPTNTPVPTATIVFSYQPTDHSCKADDTATMDTVHGTITANGKGAAGQRVRGSFGPGGQPISENDATSGPNGGYTVTFVCKGNACDGDWWVWMVDAQGSPISPYVKFTFNDDCRKGTLNFQK